MPESTLSSPPQYIAEVRNSREVTLYGTADLGYWKQKLRPEKLVPVEQNGHARLMISAVASCWLGVRFSEFLIAVESQPLPQTATSCASQGMYLLTAFNTSRAFAFMEQRYFQTPYTYGNVEVQCGPQPSIQLRQRTDEMVWATQTTPRAEAPKVHEHWEGVIYLPPSLASQAMCSTRG